MAKVDHGPVPADFAEICATLPARRVAMHYRVGHRTITRWCRETGTVIALKPRGPAIPADFAEIALTLTRPELCARYAAPVWVVARWLTDTGITPKRAVPIPPPPKRRELPTDFAAVAPTMTRQQLSTRYIASTEIIRRWCEEAGVTPRVPTPPAHRGTVVAIAQRTERDASLAGLAADHLRRSYSNIFRADILPERERRHLPDKGKGLFVVSGKGAMTPAALIDLAKAKGFDPDAWSRV